MKTNDNLDSIMGDPKDAINKLAFPTILSMLLMFLNNLIDSFGLQVSTVMHWLHLDLFPRCIWLS